MDTVIAYHFLGRAGVHHEPPAPVAAHYYFSWYRRLPVIAHPLVLEPSTTGKALRLRFCSNGRDSPDAFARIGENPDTGTHRPPRGTLSGLSVPDTGRQCRCILLPTGTVNSVCACILLADFSAVLPVG